MSDKSSGSPLPAPAPPRGAGAAESAAPPVPPRSGGRTAAVVPAAGRGERLGPGAPKALRDLGGAPVLVHAVRAMCQADEVSLVVVVAPPESPDAVRAMLASAPLPAAVEIVVVPGGANRQESVRLGLAALPEEVDVVLVHDAARALVPAATVDSVVATVRAGAPAVVPALPVTDTVKRVGRDPNRPAGAPEPVVDTVDRADLRAVQTPQGFDRSVLAEAHGNAAEGLGGEGATDCAGMVERLGRPVVLVPGHEEAFKITRPLDLVLAEAVLARRETTAP
ncbi:2-C-methyl-D-erythritol 4-phosphate cytidylyltransferase [Streptomyces spiramenti]|uniref:2-C-methyl-D-erythritol 4-phosphate cytidylyltransferase n=1 Tax=Streptomyces spiramenti TaxID=2720606 RepID=A0ABX1AFR1_9ACTN|nr:2-C-methyl-D-erythritol 4-phosphate cytidylyltransferase [Streptomyces spiramenti]NJP65993.1 2-C-methyl-D-erythritol 4-phosphate cytidylyltransferase [Streptomyces spiramenti]